jgi:Protein of unknown function (DUF2009)
MLSLYYTLLHQGARLTHSHERQYNFALQSLTLWKEIVHDMVCVYYVTNNSNPCALQWSCCTVYVLTHKLPWCSVSMLLTLVSFTVQVRHVQSLLLLLLLLHLLADATVSTITAVLLCFTIQQFRLWCLAEDDLLSSSHQYTLTQTGQVSLVHQYTCSQCFN